VLVPLLRALGEEVDLLVLSHRDADHTGGAAAVLAQQPQARALGSIEATHELQALRPIAPCLAGQRWDWDGVVFEVLHPEDGDAARALKPNVISCVLRITAAGPHARAALLAGDIETAQEQALAARGAALQADVLLVPHHGSKTSSSAVFLDAVQPRTALVQAGYRNRFGHPAADVLQRYRERGIDVVESARCGAAVWSSEQPGQVACERDAGARYWQHRPPARGQ
jgi:competence protein ComEC